MSEFRNKVNFKLDLVNKSQPYYNSWQRNTNKSIILLKSTTVSTILLTSQKATIQLKIYQVSK